VRRTTVAAFDHVLGLGLETWVPPRQAIPEAVQALAEARAAARKARDWAEADRLRQALHAAGWEMADRPDGYDLRPR